MIDFEKPFVGNAWLFGDEIDTGQIVPGQYVPLSDPVEIAEHLFEDVRPGFRKELATGDIVVAGRNFGCGSSREHAPKALRGSGVGAVLADSFARIFYRNALNLGLAVIPIPGIRAATREGDRLEIDMRAGSVRNLTQGTDFSFVPYEDFVVEMINAGGVIPYTKMKLAQEEGRAV
jgi:3-isopropylmalate/(R)-2-methylmalate dehydratase small subunit